MTLGSDKLMSWGLPFVGVVVMGAGLATHNMWIAGATEVICLACIFAWLPVAYRYWGEVDSDQEIIKEKNAPEQS